MNPVVNGYISFAQLKNGEVNLFDIFIMNELITYKQDYESIFNAESKDK